MLASVRNAFGILVLIALLLAAFSAGRALAANGSSNRVTPLPLLITNVTNEKVCGRPADGSSKEIVCFPEAAPIVETLTKPTDIVATKNATCAKDGGQWKCWGVNANTVPVNDLKMVKTQSSKDDVLFGYAANFCRIDAKNKIVSCTQNYLFGQDPLRMSSSKAPSKYGDHFGPFTKLTGVAGNAEYLCFLDDDTLKCAASYNAQKIAERKVKNATAIALTNTAICILDDSGNRCFNPIGELKINARPSWKGARKLVSNSTDVCALLATDDIECLSTNAASSLLSENKPEDLGAVKDIGLGKNFACALKTDRSVKCWSNGSAKSFEPPRELKNIERLSVAESHACALDDSGTTVCWGASNELGQLYPPLRAGTPVEAIEVSGVNCAWNSTGARCSSQYPNDIVTNMPFLENVVSISMTPGYQKTACAISKVQGGTKATCWGAQPDLAKYPEAYANPKSISFSDESACAVLADSTARCWGKPTGMPWNVIPKSVTQSDLKNDRICMIDYFGFTCWGAKLHDSKVATPAKFKNSLEVEQFALGRAHTCVRTFDAVECWGENESGQLDVPPMVDPISLMASEDTTCASDKDGVICWGPNWGISAGKDTENENNENNGNNSDNENHHP